jgi:hypothetical protein
MTSLNLDLSNVETEKHEPVEKTLRCNNRKYDYDYDLGRYFKVGDEKRTPLAKRVNLSDDSPMKFGKYKGMKLGDVPNSYLSWVVENIKGLDVQFEEYIRERL